MDWRGKVHKLDHLEYYTLFLIVWWIDFIMIVLLFANIITLAMPFTHLFWVQVDMIIANKWLFARNEVNILQAYCSQDHRIPSRIKFYTFLDDHRRQIFEKNKK